MTITEQEFIKVLLDNMNGTGLIEYSTETFPEISNLATFEEIGMLTEDKGIVIYLKTGEEFHVIVKKK